MKTSPQTVWADIERGMELAGYRQIARRDIPVILKDNISWHLPFLSANTTPWQLEGVIRYLQKNQYQNVVAVHNNTVVTNARKGERLNKLEAVYRRFQIPQLYNFSGDFQWQRLEGKFDFLALPRIYGDEIRVPAFFAGKQIIHLPTCKTHIYTTTTGSMKNAFGGLLSSKRHYTHSLIHETLVDLLQIQQRLHPSIFTVMDGTVCGSGPGPRTMTPIDKDIMLFSFDPVAIDALAARIMGFDPLAIPYIRLATERGLGNGEPSRIEVVGADVRDWNFSFRVGDNLASRAGDLLWFSPLRVLQRLFFRTPLVYLFVFASFFYHDFLWWPFKGRRIMKRMGRASPWGRLFASYPQ